MAISAHRLPSWRWAAMSSCSCRVGEGEANWCQAPAVAAARRRRRRNACARVQQPGPPFGPVFGPSPSSPPATRLIVRPGVPLDVRAQLVVPALAALLADAAGEVGGHSAPAALAMLLHQPAGGTLQGGCCVCQRLVRVGWPAQRAWAVRDSVPAALRRGRGLQAGGRAGKRAVAAKPIATMHFTLLKLARHAAQAGWWGAPWAPGALPGPRPHAAPDEAVVLLQRPAALGALPAAGAPPLGGLGLVGRGLVVIRVHGPARGARRRAKGWSAGDPSRAPLSQGGQWQLAALDRALRRRQAAPAGWRAGPANWRPAREPVLRPAAGMAHSHEPASQPPPASRKRSGVHAAGHASPGRPFTPPPAPDRLAAQLGISLRKLRRVVERGVPSGNGPERRESEEIPQ